MGYRIERDSMGEMQVPEEMLYGASTARAVMNFPISGIGMPKTFIRAIGLVKKACCRVNGKLGRLDPDVAEAIERAADDVATGALDEHFVVDIFQTGSGTSTNMNANEVIANRAIDILGAEKGSKAVHPNDHVNSGQSSNDIIPTSMHVAAVLEIQERLLPALRKLRDSFEAKAEAFMDIIKIGRTHLQDAVPIRLGQEMSGYARQVGLGIRRVEATLPDLFELAIGGTAVGTGLNAPEGFGEKVAAELGRMTGHPFREAENHFEAQAAQDSFVFVAGALNTLAASLMKIANDIRLLGSGPRCGIGELKLPAVQPGSSIMPGKVNPVLCESVVQVAAQVTGHCLSVTLGGQWGQIDLNTMLPMMAHNLLESIRLLGNVAEAFRSKCIDGLEADEEKCEAYIEQSMALATGLNPKIGYDRAAEIAKKAHKTGRTVREVASEETDLSKEDLEACLDAAGMT